MAKAELLNRSRSKFRKTFRYKLIKYILGEKLVEELITFTNTCPIFWVFVACVFISIVYAPIKFIFGNLYKVIVYAIDSIASYIEKKTELRYENSLKPRYISDDDLFDAWKYYDYIENSFKWYGKSVGRGFFVQLFNIKYPKKDIEKYKENFQSRYIKERELLKIEAEKRKRMVADLKGTFTIKTKKKERSEDEKAKLRQTLNAIINFGKSVVGIIITLLMTAFVFFIVEMINSIVLLIISSWNGSAILNVLSWIGIVVAALVGIAVIGYILWLMFRNVKVSIKFKWVYPVLKVLSYITLPFVWVGKLFILLWKGIKYVVLGTIGAFKGYFGKEYSGYCPGIKWED